MSDIVRRYLLKLNDCDPCCRSSREQHPRTEGGHARQKVRARNRPEYIYSPSSKGPPATPVRGYGYEQTRRQDINGVTMAQRSFKALRKDLPPGERASHGYLQGVGLDTTFLVWNPTEAAFTVSLQNIFSRYSDLMTLWTIGSTFCREAEKRMTGSSYLTLFTPSKDDGEESDDEVLFRSGGFVLYSPPD